MRKHLAVPPNLQHTSSALQISLNKLQKFLLTLQSLFLNLGVEERAMGVKNAKHFPLPPCSALWSSDLILYPNQRQNSLILS